MASEALLASLRAAVEAAPDDLALRLHLAQVLTEAGYREESVRQAAAVLQRDPANADAVALIAGTASPPAAPDTSSSLPAAPSPPPAPPLPVTPPDPAPGAPEAPGPPAATPPPAATGSGGADGELCEEETLRRLDAELSDIVASKFTDSDSTQGYQPAASGLRLADVGGMDEVKERLEASFLAPLRNPELVRLYGKSLRGGLLLYGPPGCGKTFIARAVAGEMGARFLPVSLADVLDMYIGSSERNIHEVFEVARRGSPCVVFLDEVDAIGQKRSQLRSSAARGTVNQLLTELDGLTSANDGVYVLAATNHPWDVDVALRRPGRFDRMLLVLPPDRAAREAILRYHLTSRPITGVDVGKLAKATDGYSGADLAYVCETAVERALSASARSGTVRMVEMADLEQAVREVRPSIGAWLDTARNVAQFANEGGAYDDLLAYLRKRRLV